jgi:hypothetical protein
MEHHASQHMFFPSTFAILSPIKLVPSSPRPLLYSSYHSISLSFHKSTPPRHHVLLSKTFLLAAHVLAARCSVFRFSKHSKRYAHALDVFDARLLGLKFTKHSKWHAMSVGGLETRKKDMGTDMTCFMYEEDALQNDMRLRDGEQRRCAKNNPYRLHVFAPIVVLLFCL